MKQKVMKATRTSKYEDVQNNNKKRIVYEDELDGNHEYEPYEPSEDEEPKENYRNNRKKHEKENIVTKKTKKGITKSIKM